MLDALVERKVSRLLSVVNDEPWECRRWNSPEETEASLLDETLERYLKEIAQVTDLGGS
jgi:hypothetical protein